MERSNTSWPVMPGSGPRPNPNHQYNLNKYRQAANPSTMSSGGSNTNGQWRHYQSAQKTQQPRRGAKEPEKKSFVKRFEFPLLMLVALGVIFSAFAFYRANQTYLALGDVSSNLLAAVEEIENSQPQAIAVQPQAAPEVPTGPVDVAVEDDDPFLGSPDAPVTIVEFSDFECPFCARFTDTAKQIIATYGDQVRFVYRDFPLSIHENAESAAIAAQCAYQLAGSKTFFVYHDELFANQSSLGDSLYDQLASDFGLDSQAFSDCREDPATKAEVDKDFQDGITAGVKGTPSTFINGNNMSGAVPFEQIKAIIDEELK